MVKAVWNDVVIAEAADTVVVENNHYFAVEAITPDLLEPSATTSVCGWKGTANYYSIVAGGKVNADAAWYYPHPKEAAANIKDRVAFWKGVKIG